MNWKTFISKMKSEYPKLTPDKLYDYINKFQGSKSKSDIEEVKAWWTKMVIKWFKDYAGVPKGIDRKKLKVQKRILYITKQKNYEFSWRIFHPSKVVSPIDKKLEYNESTLSKREYKSINHERNITRVLQNNKIIK